MKVALFGYDFFFDCHQVAADHATEVLRIFSYPADNTHNFNTRLRDLAHSRDVEFLERRVTAEDLKVLEREGCDLLVVAAYPYKIPIGDTPSLRGINVHPSLLPIGRGPWPLPWTILKGMPQSGVTIHKLAEALDSGDILHQTAFPISDMENLETLSCKVQIHAKQALQHCLLNFETLWSNAKPQEGESSYWSAPSDEDRTLKWDQGIQEVCRVARAFGKFDSYAEFGGKEWIVQDVSAWHEQHPFTPGEVVHQTSKEVVIAASDGLVCVRYYTIDPDWQEH